MAASSGIRDRYEAARAAGRPLVGAHRGNSAEEPENTLRSFESALALGVDVVECDVHLSKDGEPVVIHDHELERTTDGHGLVRELTLTELRALDAGQGEKIPLLDEVIAVVRGGAALAIELKQAPLAYEGLEQKVVERLRAAAMLDDASVISFRHASAKLAKQLEPRLQTGILEVGMPVDPVAVLRAADADVYSPHWSGADEALVQQVHAAGCAVGLWVIDDDLSLYWARLVGADSIFTNRPREILAKLGKY